MKVKRCIGVPFEEANGEFFIRVPAVNIATSDSAESTSCWVPDVAKTPLRSFMVKRSMSNFKKVLLPEGVSPAPELEKPFLFVLADLNGKDYTFSVSDTIVFAGGDILALMEPVAAFGLLEDGQSQSESPPTPDGRH